MKVYEHDSGHIRISLTKNEAEALSYLIDSFTSMLQFHDIEDGEYKKEYEFVNKLSEARGKARFMAEARKRAQQFKRKV